MTQDQIPVNVRERLAVDLMGWALDPNWGMYHDSEGREIYLPDGGYMVPVGNMIWKPDQNERQARLCLLKIGEQDLGAYVVAAFKKVRFATGAINVHEFDLMTAEPAEICQAIIQVLDQKGKE